MSLIKTASLVVIVPNVQTNPNDAHIWLLFNSEAQKAPGKDAADWTFALEAALCPPVFGAVLQV